VYRRSREHHQQVAYKYVTGAINGFDLWVILNTAKDYKGPHRTAKDFKKTAKDRKGSS